MRNMSELNNNKTIPSCKSTSSNINSRMVEPGEQQEIVCPYDASHLIRPCRLANHLLRCARNHPGSKLVRCPFNSCHLQQPDQLQAHIQQCEDRHSFERFCYPDTLPPKNPSYNTAVDSIDTTENWDMDPEVPCYNPQAYCEENMLIRNLQGASKATRRQFRENERRRFKESKNL